MASKFSDLIAYFEMLATKHKSIGHTPSEKHFFRMEIDEVLAGINRPSGVKFPFLILEGYGLGFSDNRSDSILKKRKGAFILLDHISDATNMDEVHQKWDELEEIGTDILIKIRADKRKGEVPVVSNFSINDTDGSLIRNELGNDVGIRFMYDIDSPVSSDVDLTKWLE